MHGKPPMNQGGWHLWFLGLLFAVGLALGDTRLPAHAQPSEDRPGGSALHAAEARFLAARGPAREQRWVELLQALTPVLRSPPLFTVPASRLAEELSRGRGHLGYQVQDWHTGVGVLRLVTIIEGAPDMDVPPIFLCRSVHAAAVLIWRSPTGGLRDQVVWRSRGFDGSASPFPQESPVLDVRAWASTDGSWRMALITEDACGGSGGNSPTVNGVALPSGNHDWMANAMMFPLDVYAPLGTTSYLFSTFAFADRAGQSVRLSVSDQSSLFSECNACPHVRQTRLLVRTGDAYSLRDWQIVSSPYAAVVTAATTAWENVRGNCVDVVTNLKEVADRATGQALCAIDWSGAPAASGNPDTEGDGPTPAQVVVIVQPSGSSAGTKAQRVSLTVVRTHSVWVITHVQRAI